MANVSELISRADLLVEKYGRYDVPLQPLNTAEKGADAFEAEAQLIAAEVDKLVEQAEEVSKISNRAAVAARNAEIRRTKNALLQKRLEGLQKKAKKGRNVTNEVLTSRLETVRSLAERIKGIPDGVRTGGGAPSGSNDKYVTPSNSAYTRVDINTEVKAQHYQHTDETRQFEEDWQRAKAQQDEALGRIELGVGVLGNLAKDMNEELDRQNPIMDAIDTQLDRVGQDIKTRNQQMKGVLKKIRSSRNLCVDMILIIVLLALAAYIYSLVT